MVRWSTVVVTATIAAIVATVAASCDVEWPRVSRVKKCAIWHVTNTTNLTNIHFYVHGIASVSPWQLALFPIAEWVLNFQ